MRSKHSKERKNTEKENGKNILISLKTKEKKEDIQNERNNRKSKRGNKNKIKAPEHTKRKKKIKLIILLIVVILILSFGIRMAISANSWKSLVQEMSKNENSIVKDTDGNTIAEIGSEKAKNKISATEIPNNLKNAYVAIEDERFYKHHGVDVKRTGAAVVSYVFHRGSSSFGGSSITQQVVKNLTGDSSSKISRKVNEWGKAVILESFMNKDEILALYLNIIYVGPNVYGIETGANYYFNKSAKDLSLEECAFLAGINNSPNSYNPYSDTDNTEKIKKRTKTVLSKMLELKYINEDEYNNAVANVDGGLKFKKGKIEINDVVYSYHTDALISQLIDDIATKKKITKTFATNYVNMAGLTIYSTQNTSIQKQMEKEFEKTKYQLASKTGGDHSQSAMVIIDHKTGQVVGCVGGLGKKTTSRGLNRATQSIRQTGSCIKPIAVLVPGIAKKEFTGSTIFEDEQAIFADGYKPENYSNYLGKITVRRALESSQNIPFVEMMEKIGPKTSMKYLEKMGVTTLSKNDENLALALGGLDKGISPLQMAGAYATIANDGEYIEPTFYTKAETSNKKTIVEVKQKKRRVFSKEVAYIVKELLTEPVKGSYGTATYCSISGMDVAAKTGTTDDNYDRWLCGFTPYYTGVTWYGYDKNESINYNGKKNPAGILWANIMSNVHSSLKNAKFNKPAGAVKVTVCAETGRKANTGCPNTYDEYFLIGTTPTLCNKHAGTELKDDSSSSSTNTNKTNTATNSFDTTTKDDLDVPTTTVKEEPNTVNENVNSSKPKENTTKENSNKENNNSNTGNSNNKNNSSKTDEKLNSVTNNEHNSAINNSNSQKNQNSSNSSNSKITNSTDTTIN